MLKRLRTKFIVVMMVICVVFISNVTGIIIYSLSDSFEFENNEFLDCRLTAALHPDSKQESRVMMFVPYAVLKKSGSGDIEVLDSTRLFNTDDPELLETYFDAVQEKDRPMGLLRKYSVRYMVSRDNSDVIIVSDATNELHMMTNMLKIALLSWFGAVVVFFGISIVLARWMVKPVEDAWKQQRQFISDASHELKTPLTVIMTNAEMLQNELPENRYASNISVMSQQMRGLVEGMLELARIDNAGETVEESETDLSKTVADAILPFEPIFFEKGLELESDITEGIRFKGSEDHITHVVDILLDNAQKYASENGKVTVKLEKHQKQHCTLTVANSGEPLSEEDCENIFKRFYRVDKVRTMSHSYGLGLPIAKSIVERCRGQIRAESRDGMIIFTVTLPTV